MSFPMLKRSPGIPQRGDIFVAKGMECSPRTVLPALLDFSQRTPAFTPAFPMNFK